MPTCPTPLQTPIPSRTSFFSTLLEEVEQVARAKGGTGGDGAVYVILAALHPQSLATVWP